MAKASPSIKELFSPHVFTHCKLPALFNLIKYASWPPCGVILLIAALGSKSTVASNPPVTYTSLLLSKRSIGAVTLATLPLINFTHTKLPFASSFCINTLWPLVLLPSVSTLGPGSTYAKDLAKAAGATIDTVLGQLSEPQLLSMVTKQRVWEGFKAGQVIQAANGGVFDGPKSGYSATLHGKEAVIPLKDGAVPVSMSQEFNMTATNLGELVNQMRGNMAIQDRMLAVLEDIKRSQSTMADNTSRMAAVASN
jgi:hypothetical protein